MMSWVGQMNHVSDGVGPDLPMMCPILKLIRAVLFVLILAVLQSLFLGKHYNTFYFLSFTFATY